MGWQIDEYWYMSDAIFHHLGIGGASVYPPRVSDSFSTVQ